MLLALLSCDFPPATKFPSPSTKRRFAAPCAKPKYSVQSLPYDFPDAATTPPEMPDTQADPRRKASCAARFQRPAAGRLFQPVDAPESWPAPAGSDPDSILPASCELRRSEE